jgi:hypothetical protein
MYIFIATEEEGSLQNKMNLLLILSRWFDSLESSITEPFGNLYSSLKIATKLWRIKV